MLLIPLITILVLVILAVTLPFWRKDPDSIALYQDEDRSQELADLDVEREVLVRSLQELEVELAQGRMELKDHLRLKATDEHRLFQVLERMDHLRGIVMQHGKETSVALRGRSPWLAAIFCGIVVAGASLGIYTYVQWQAIQKFAAVQSQMAGQGPNPLEMVARLEERLRKNPDDLQGQMMAGRSYQALERIEEAKQAWEKVIELAPKNHEAHYNLGVLLVENRKFDDPEIFKQALAHFEIVLADRPKQPGVNWYRGLALWYLKRYRETDQAWTTAFQNLEPASKDAEFVKAALTKLRDGEPPF